MTKHTTYLGDATTNKLLFVIAFLGLGLILGLMLGLIASTGSVILVALITALIVSAALIASPQVLLWVVIIGALVLSGIADLYFPQVRQARWGIVIAAVGLGFVSLSALLWSRNSRISNVPFPARTPTMVWALLFFLITVFSAFINQRLSVDAIVGLKGYFQVWGVLLAFAFLPIQKESPDRLMKLLFWIALLQLPFVLHQYFVLVPQRSGLIDAARAIVSQDIIVGTFSGSLTGGGAGPAMAILLMVALVASIAGWRTGKLSLFRLFILGFLFLFPLAIGEHKISLVLLPISFILIFEDKVRLNPAKAIGLSMVSAIILVLLFTVFTLLPRAGSNRHMDASEYLEETLSYNVGERGYGLAKLNRTTVYPFWLDNHQSGSGGVLHTFVGYGPGASKSASGGIAEHSLAEEKYPFYAIGLTGVSGLLWDVGLLGAFTAIGFLMSVFLLTRRYLSDIRPNDHYWPYLKTVEAGVAMMAISLLHNNMFIYEIGFQTLMMVLVGYVIYYSRVHGVSRRFKV